jgi:DNA-binding NarL/FixJ family response regulator
MSGSSDRRITVLIVDDHKVVRQGLVGFLATEPGIEVVGDAGDGSEALDQLSRLGDDELPDVVLMDLQMQPMGGVEATAEIRSRYQDVEVVVLTSFVDEDDVHAALAAGASGYLLKDADAEDVAAAVRAAHEGELHLDPAVARRLMSSIRGGKKEEPAAELTPREIEILRMVAAGMANKQIAAELVISERTARSHVSNILRKLGLSSRTQAALWAVREGFAPDAGAAPGA